MPRLDVWLQAFVAPQPPRSGLAEATRASVKTGTKTVELGAKGTFEDSKVSKEARFSNFQVLILCSFEKRCIQPKLYVNVP